MPSNVHFCTIDNWYPLCIECCITKAKNEFFSQRHFDDSFDLTLLLFQKCIENNNSQGFQVQKLLFLLLPLNRSSFQAFYCSHSGLGPPVKFDVLQGEKSHESNRSVGLIRSNFSTLIRLEKRTNHRKVGANIYGDPLGRGWLSMYSMDYCSGGGENIV